MLKWLINKKVLQRIETNKRGRDVDLYSDDIFIVSYPKSGNTWMRFLLGNLQYKNFNFSTMENYIPDVYVTNNLSLKEIPRPRILKSHEYFHPKYNKIIYIVRDPRSVAVSYYYYLKKTNYIDKHLDFSKYLEFFIHGEYDNFATWNEHVQSWLSTRSNSNDFLIVKYEDLQINPLEQMLVITNFIGLISSKEDIQTAIQKSSFKNMRVDEIKNQNVTAVLNKSDLSIPFIRKAQADEWKEYFSENDIALLKSSFGNTMNKLGYTI